MKKHIALLVPSFPVPSETFVITEANALVRVGHKVTIFTFKKLGLSNTLNKEINVVEVPCPDRLGTLSYLLSHPILSVRTVKLSANIKMVSKQSLIAWSVSIAKLVTLHKIQHIHCHFLHAHASYGCLAARLTNITVSGVGHGHDVYINNKDLKNNLRLFHFVVAVCEEMASHFISEVGHKTKLLHCGINTHFFKPQVFSAKESTHLVFVGRLVEKKGLKYLIDAMACINKDLPLYIDIVGDGPLLSELQAQVQKHKLQSHIRFLGAKEPAWISENLPKYSGFVAPFCEASNGDRDTGPVVLKEAMACGLPIITTDFMGCREIVGSAGLMCLPKDVESLKARLIQFYDMSPHSRLALAKQAVARVNQHFDANNQAKKISHWIQGARANI
jgi:glycosyltransferase involved in cell wall biosynthesis